MTSPSLYVFFGLIASGKSTLSELFAKSHKAPCYNTDRVRKELAGIAASESRPDGMGQGIYTPEFTARTYQAMLEQAAEDMAGGIFTVVLDGSYARKSDRDQVRALGDKFKAKMFFIFCSCSDREVKRRLELRKKDPDAVSDGRWEIFVHQQSVFEFPVELPSGQLLELDTERPPEELLSIVEQFCLTSS